MRPIIVLASAAAALSVGAGNDTLFGGPAPPRSAKLRVNPDYRPKTPRSTYDHDRVRAANLKRFARSGKQQHAFAATWANYHPEHRWNRDHPAEARS